MLSEKTSAPVGVIDALSFTSGSFHSCCRHECVPFRKAVRVVVRPPGNDGLVICREGVRVDISSLIAFLVDDVLTIDSCPELRPCLCSSDSESRFPGEDIRGLAVDVVVCFICKPEAVCQISPDLKSDVKR